MRANRLLPLLALAAAATGDPAPAQQRPAPLLTLHGHTNCVNTVAYSPDGTRLATGSSDYNAGIWDSGTGKRLLTFAEHRDWLFCLAYNSDGRLLATAGFHGGVRVWDTRTGRLAFALPPRRRLRPCVIFSPDGKRLAVSFAVNYDDDGDDRHVGEVEFWDTFSGHCLGAWRGHTDLITRLAYSPDGRRLSSGSRDGTV